MHAAIAGVDRASSPHHNFSGRYFRKVLGQRFHVRARQAILYRDNEHDLLLSLPITRNASPSLSMRRPHAAQRDEVQAIVHAMWKEPEMVW